MICTYCGLEKPPEEISAEHVLPAAIGGRLSPVNPFRLNRVCRNCNSAAGRNIDGSFIRSWSIQNARAQNAFRYIEFNADAVFPLRYIGELEETLVPGKVCDYWLGPSGDSIFHLHDPYPETMGPGIVGGPSNVPSSQLDPGFAFVVVIATNPVWHRPIVNSIVESLDNATLYLVNGGVPPGGPFQVIPPELSAVRTRIQNLVRERVQTRITVARDFGHRFLAKFALGCGGLFLDDAFVTSSHADLLRRALRQRDMDLRAELRIHGSDFFSGTRAIADAIQWPAGHVIIFKQIQNALCVCPVFYGQIAAVIAVSDVPAHWQGRLNPDGTVFAIAPGLRRCVGPVDLSTFVAARQLPNEPVHVELQALFAAADIQRELPPFHVDELDVAAARMLEQNREMIRKRAYELWIERGVWGDPLTDWKNAKKELGFDEESSI